MVGEVGELVGEFALKDSTTELFQLKPIQLIIYYSQGTISLLAGKSAISHSLPLTLPLLYLPQYI